MKKIIRYCKWCGKPFAITPSRQTNAIKYCNDKCRKYAKMEQDNQAQHRYQTKYKWLHKDADLKGRLGESRIGASMEQDFKEEYKQVHAELRRRKLCRN